MWRGGGGGVAVGVRKRSQRKGEEDSEKEYGSCH